MTYFDLTCDIVLTVGVSPDYDDFRLGSCPAFVGVAPDVDGVLGVRPQTLYLSGGFTVHHNTLYLFTYKENKTGCLQMITKLVSNRWQHKPSSRFCNLEHFSIARKNLPAN